MIIETIINAVTSLLKAVLGILPNLPDIPNSIMNSLNNVFDTIFNNLDLLGLFVRLDTIKILVPLLVVAINFEHIYHFTIWIIKKIPLSID